jgi:hypothetical protein
MTGINGSAVDILQLLIQSDFARFFNITSSQIQFNNGELSQGGFSVNVKAMVPVRVLQEGQQGHDGKSGGSESGRGSSGASADGGLDDEALLKVSQCCVQIEG